jgi:hypothetical protein
MESSNINQLEMGSFLQLLLGDVNEDEWKGFRLV